MRILLDKATIINEGKTLKGSIFIEGEDIVALFPAGKKPNVSADITLDLSGCFILPGVIDSHVHFREPGMTEKGNIESESRAAAIGGVTTFFDMPNTYPTTTTIDALEDKFRIARQKSYINYSFFFGANGINTNLFSLLDRSRIPGIKLFMGASTGGILPPEGKDLERIFAQTPLPLVAHCEDMNIIRDNISKAIRDHRGSDLNENDNQIDNRSDLPIEYHPIIRSSKACYASSSLAVSLAKKYSCHLHVAHISTKEELSLFCSNDPFISAEVVVGHLLFTSEDYQSKGTLIKVNPAIKNKSDQRALLNAIADGRISTVATDHAPHLLSQKVGGCLKAASGMPLIQFSLPSMLSLVDKGIISIERLVELMCHAPARIFGVQKRGFLRSGYKADIVIVRPNVRWKLNNDIIESLCKWSPLEGTVFNWHVETTLCNGHLLYHNGKIDTNYIGQEVKFSHK